MDERIQEIIQEMEEEINWLRNPEGSFSMERRALFNNHANTIEYYKGRLEGKPRED